MMQQYLQVKEKCKDSILFFRLGDFYEMFFEDAEVASRELELVLTGRDCGLENRAPMCGIPYHAANSYIARLVGKGYKIAICEQLEDPSVAKGIVKRDIIKIITPGTYTDSSFLDENKNNYIMSLYIDILLKNMGICFTDISTGDFYCTNTKYNANVILNEISKYRPSEIILLNECDKDLLNIINERYDVLITNRDKEFFESNAINNLREQFSDFNEDIYNSCTINAANGMINYIFETQKHSLRNINILHYYSVEEYLNIDINTRRNLELTESQRDKSKKGSLLWIMDKTCTSMGARELRRWIEQPLISKKKIDLRLDAVDELISNIALRNDLKDSLAEIYDIERIIGKIASKSVNAKELTALKNSLEKIPKVKNIIGQCSSAMIKNMFNDIDDLQDIYSLLDKAIMDNPALSVKEGSIIKDLFSEEVDNLRSAKAHGKEWIAQLEQQEREFTGIKSLKVSYNKVFGYYIEITNANKGLIPDGRYIRKQTLANAERYITQELKEMEDKILGAEDKLMSIEYEIFIKIRDEVEKQIDRMKKTAKFIAELDCLTALANLAVENNYCRPDITENGVITIKEGRHPVVEKVIPTGTFVFNDTLINNKEDMLLIITGPNMAGKSTYMRQVALITLMAQIGSFVPASSASISICDRIFTRIGASDDLTSGKSTFMVEMWEVSNILKNATNRSLVLLDEVGRGTSTYDGLSIAWAVIEYICKTKDIRCKTLFATHYHELTKLEGKIKGVKNYSVAVKEVENEIIFLRKIIRGGADQSYGVEVAKLAGLPESVIVRAKEILNSLEEEHLKNEDISVRETAVDANINNIVQLSFSDIEKDSIIEEIKKIDILNLTPMEGFNKLYDLIKKVKSL
ncbi:DNA mismatch repair protein MutS [Clostridiales bacterium oral taxon 876 str. F0540]|nr:DNA mismatch repair protein MutS [Clostridiales bacterium oral taxon 876 str. F0540]